MSETTKAPALNDSILVTIKKMLGLDLDYDAFNADIIVFINSAMMTLQQLGVGPTRGFVVTGLEQMWSDFLPSDTMLEGVKHYIFLRAKMAFDSVNVSSSLMEVMKAEKEELEWRLREQAEFYPGDGSRKGYFEQDDVISDGEETGDGTKVYHLRAGDTYSGSDGGFRAHGGWYASDPDFPWKDGPSQPAVSDPDGE